MRRILFGAALLISVVLLPGAAGASANDDSARQQNLFVARLTGAQEVPAVDSAATGRASFLITDNDTKIRFRISERGVARITQSHIHVGAAGTAGPVVLFLFPTFAVKGSVDGEGWSVSGTLTAADLIPQAGATPAVNTFADAIAAIRSGNTYANIHSPAHPGGEIRGQLRPAFSDDDD